MKRIPLFFQTEEESMDLSLTIRTDKLGNVLYCVEYLNNDGTKDYAFFTHLSSALDFIHSNFK